VAVKSFYDGQEYLYRLVKLLAGGNWFGNRSPRARAGSADRPKTLEPIVDRLGRLRTRARNLVESKGDDTHFGAFDTTATKLHSRHIVSPFDGVRW